MNLKNSVAIVYTPLQRKVINLITSDKRADIIDFYNKEAIISDRKLKLNVFNVILLKFQLNKYKEYFIPHDLGVFSNYIINNCYGVINYYYEGVLYIRNINNNLIISNLYKKKIYSFLLGFKYKPEQILSLSNINVKRVYIPKEASKLVSLKQKVVFFKFNEDGGLNNLDLDKVLILGGVEERLTENFLKILKKELRENPTIQFYYKPHPSIESKDVIKSNLQGKNISIIESSISAEDIIFQLAPYKILSLNPSSALLHAKFFNNNIETFYLKNNIDEVLREKYRLMNIYNLLEGQ